MVTCWSHPRFKGSDVVNQHATAFVLLQGCLEASSSRYSSCLFADAAISNFVFTFTKRSNNFSFESKILLGLLSVIFFFEVVFLITFNSLFLFG